MPFLISFALLHLNIDMYVLGIGSLVKSKRKSCHLHHYLKDLLMIFIKGYHPMNLSIQVGTIYGAINHTLVIASEGIPPKTKKLKQEENTMFDCG